MKKLLAIFGSFGLITTASGNLISCNNPSDKTGTVKTPSEVAADFTSTPLELKINNQGENLIFGEAIQQKDITTWVPVLGEIEKMANAFFQDYANDHHFTFQLGAYNATNNTYQVTFSTTGGESVTSEIAIKCLVINNKITINLPNDQPINVNKSETDLVEAFKIKEITADSNIIVSNEEINYASIQVTDSFATDNLADVYSDVKCSHTINAFDTDIQITTAYVRAWDQLEDATITKPDNDDEMDDLINQLLREKLKLDAADQHIVSWDINDDKSQVTFKINEDYQNSFTGSTDKEYVIPIE
jgi:metal-dependent amidase/aminoacylase/carboxypeptidase family protein